MADRDYNTIMDLVALTAVVLTLGGPVYLVNKWLGLRAERQRRGLDAPGVAAELQALRDERRQLLERVEHLETVVYGEEFELNRKLSRLAQEQQLLPADGRDALPRLRDQR